MSRSLNGVLLLTVLLIIGLFRWEELPAQDNVTLIDREIGRPSDSVRTVETTRCREFAFKPKQLIVPLGLLGAGLIVYYSEDYHNLNKHVQTGMTNIRKDRYFHHDDWLQYIPAAAYLGLGFYKHKRKLDFKERVLVEATAYVSMAALVNIAKYSFRERRPNSNARNSFPSGHTATAFTGAELIREEFGWVMGGLAYGVATGVAVLRLYNNFHWLNDVVAGAGLGILSARIGYWMLPLYRKWFHWDCAGTKSFVTMAPQLSRDNLGVNIFCLF